MALRDVAPSMSVVKLMREKLGVKTETEIFSSSNTFTVIIYRCLKPKRL